MSASPTPAGSRGGAPARGTADAAARVTGTHAAIRALQAALTAEHAAIYGYGVAGAHLTGARQKAAAGYWAVHEAARDTLAAMITALGAQPVAAATAYRLPFPVRGEQAAITLAAYLEDRVTTAYLGLVAVSDARLRAFGARAAQSAALRATSWRGRTFAFPGLEVPAPGPVPSGSGATQRTPGPSASGGAVPSTPPTGPAGG
jgi:hypothetical protein